MQETVYAWLECQVKNREIDGDVTIEVLLQDDSPTTISVHPTVLGNSVGKDYVKVEYIAERHKLIYLKLPRPSMQHGHNITVKSSKVKKTL